MQRTARIHTAPDQCNAAGAVFDTVTVSAAEVVALPAASLATAVIVTLPFWSFVVSTLTANGVVVAIPSDVEPAKNSTLATPTLSVAFAVNDTVPLSVAPAAGAVMLTCGAMVSGGDVPKSIRPYRPPLSPPIPAVR